MRGISETPIGKETKNETRIENHGLEGTLQQWRIRLSERYGTGKAVALPAWQPRETDGSRPRRQRGRSRNLRNANGGSR